jgi:hypothetical protein
MKSKRVWLVMLAIVVAFGIGTGCDIGVGGKVHNDQTYTNDDGENNTGETTSITYTSLTPDGKAIELIITKPPENRAVVTLPNGSTYVLKIDGVVVSKGTVITGGDGKAVFTSEKGYTFTAEIGDDAVAILDTVTMDDGTTITLPEFGHKNDNYYDEYLFVLSSDSTVLSINIFRSGDGTAAYLPTDERCAKWVLQNDENKGVFPIGKWIESGDVGKGEDEQSFLLFTASTLTRVSPWFDTYRYDYRIDGTNLLLSSIYRVPYIPTAEEQEYIDNFHTLYETAFRAARLWIPATSTISPTATKVKIELDGGKKLGIEFNIVDNPDMAFINDNAVIGVWTVVDFVDEYAGYNPSNPQQPDTNFWAGLKFEENGVLSQKYRGDADWHNGGKWTKGVLQTGNTAPEYEIKTYADGAYIFVQWKSGDYTVRARKPSYYVFKKTGG